MSWTKAGRASTQKEGDFQHAGLFRVEVEGLPIGLFQEVKLPTVEVAVIEYNYGESKSPQKRPGHVKYGNITLKRGYNLDRTLAQWVEAVAAGKPERKSMSFIQLDEEGNETMRWNAYRCWPSKWNGPGMEGSKDEIAVEEVEIVCESFSRAA